MSCSMKNVEHDLQTKDGETKINNIIEHTEK